MNRSLGALLSPMLIAAAPMPLEQAAKLFGNRPAIEHISLSPDGKRVAIVSPSTGRGSVVFVTNDAGETKPIIASDGNPFRLTSCGWSAADRLVCSEYGISSANYDFRLPYIRMFALNTDGTAIKPLGRPMRSNELRISQFSGGIIDWMSGADGNVLMERDFVPQQTTGTLLGNTGDGFGVERVDTRTLHAVRVEAPRRNAVHYISDGQGHVRIIGTAGTVAGDLLNGQISYLYRDDKGGSWKPLASNDANDTGIQPIAVDSTLNVAYALKKLDGRKALYRLSLDGSGKTELIYANPVVDVDDVVQVGRNGRVIGATYVAEQRSTIYFDPAYQKLAQSLSRAVPGLPLISFVDSSGDENALLLRASSDIEPGRYFLLDRTSHAMKTIMSERPDLDGVKLGTMKPINFPGPDGKIVPGYLTLPPGSDGKNLPAIVLPHGGPGARDDWGFDYLVQFYAARGFAVLQPEFRGSSGYGDNWFGKNGFQAWRLAIGDVAAAGRWLVDQHIADPNKLAIVGWSYGGYAALQSQVLAPGLFKASIAIAPVTDLAMLKEEAKKFTIEQVQADFIGQGPHIVEGSPLKHANAFTAPVLLFHGDQDLNVSIEESRAMVRALNAAGKQANLVTYAGLDHQLHDSEIRIDMLTRSDAFLHQALHF